MVDLQKLFCRLLTFPLVTVAAVNGKFLTLLASTNVWHNLYLVSAKPFHESPLKIIFLILMTSCLIQTHELQCGSLHEKYTFWETQEYETLGSLSVSVVSLPVQVISMLLELYLVSVMITSS